MCVAVSGVDYQPCVAWLMVGATTTVGKTDRALNNIQCTYDQNVDTYHNGAYVHLL